MTIVNPDIINKWEMELIESLTADLDVREVCRLFRDKYGLRLRENLELDRGRIATFNNQIAYEFRFKAIAFCPVVIDRTGKFQGFGRTDEKDAVYEDRPGSDAMLSDPEVIRRKEIDLINAIASNFNLEGLGTLLGKQFKVQIMGEPQFQSGELVVFKDHAGFQLNFEMAIHFSILVGRNGNYLHFGDFKDHRVSAENDADPDARNAGPENETMLNIDHEPGT